MHGKVRPEPFAWQIANAVRGGETSAMATLERCLDRIETLNPVLNAYTDVTRDRAIAAAATVDARIDRGEDPGPLAGVPFAVKNLFDVAGLPTRAGSMINRSHPPAEEDGALVQRLTAAGAVLVGALNMGEYAYDFTGENAHDGACRNPHDTARITGGSSSGCGSATAAGLAPISLGSDTNGSIRVPSSLCGIFGLKPTYGRLTRRGSFPFCDSLDHLGPFARCVRDLAVAYDAVQGPDARDQACANRPVEPVLNAIDRGIDGLRIAVAGGYFGRGGESGVFDKVARAGATLRCEREVDIPGAAYGRAAAYIITNAESSLLHLDRLRERADDFDPDTRDRFLAGAILPASWYLQAQKVRGWYHNQVMALFRSVDVIIAPAMPCVAPKIGQKTMVLDGKEMLVRPNLGLFTQPISCIGLPVCAAPMAAKGELPIGIQIIAAPWREDICLRVARALEVAGVSAAHMPAIADDVD